MTSDDEFYKNNDELSNNVKTAIADWLESYGVPPRKVFAIKSANLYAEDSDTTASLYLTYIEDEHGNERNLVIEGRELVLLWRAVARA